MKESIFRTDDVPAEERFGWWSDLMRQGFAPMTTFCEETDRFVARQRMWELGDVQVWEVDCTPSGMRRPPKLIRKSDPETCCVYVTRRGKMLAENAGRSALCAPGDLYTQDTSHPSSVTLRAPENGSRHRALAVMVPRTNLPLSAGRIDRALGVHVPRNDRIGGLLSTVLTQVIDDSDGFRLADGPRLGVVIRDLVTALFARILDEEANAVPESREQVLALRIREYVLHNLSDSDLSPSHIATAHHISASYLHQLFRRQDLTLARWIRHQRLERARSDLANAALGSVAVQDIAARWGFRSPADFTRAFRTAYGMPPREYRYQCLEPNRGRDG